MFRCRRYGREIQSDLKRKKGGEKKIEKESRGKKMWEKSKVKVII